MVLYEPVIGNNVFNNIIDYPELIKFINDGDLKKEYEKLYRKISRKYQGEELKFQVKRKLYEKGFSKEEITNIMNEQDEFSPLA